MNHDELLAKIDGIAKFWMKSIAIERKEIKALRAVVELHKPMPPDLSGFIGCDGCSEGDDDYYQLEYPCQTIQAIEKELS